MNNLLQNKKIMIPIVVSVVVIMLAIIIFIAIGVKEKKDKQKNGGPVEFANSTQASAEPSSKNSTNTSNKTDPDEKIVSNEEALKKLDKKQRNAIIAFIEGLSDKDTMESFINDYFDTQAYIAYKNVDGDESSLFDEYNNIDQDEIDKLNEKLLSTPETLQELQTVAEGMTTLANSLNETDTEISTDNEEIDFTIRAVEATELDHYNEDDEKYGKTVVTISMWGEEQEVTFIFYGDVIIYIEGADGKPFLDDLDEIGE